MPPPPSQSRNDRILIGFVGVVAVLFYQMHYLSDVDAVNTGNFGHLFKFYLINEM